MEKEPKVLFTFYKKADKVLNRILIPKFIIDTYGRDFCLKIYDDGSMMLIPKKEEE